jgi:DNA-binding transcriptional regulator YhcF (GntR family)
VYAGKDPLTGCEFRFRKTRRTEVEAQIELGKLLELARAGRNPDLDITVAELLDAWVPVAGWDVSTAETNLGYIRRTIKPALGTREVRKVRGPLLDNLYARLQQCGNLACAGKPFTEHRHVPDLRPDPSDARMEWEQAADRLREAIASGELAAGDALPSVPDLARLQGLKPGTLCHTFLVLEADGLLLIRHGRTTQVAGERPESSDPATRYRPARSRPGHDCSVLRCPRMYSGRRPCRLRGRCDRRVSTDGHGRATLAARPGLTCPAKSGVHPVCPLGGPHVSRDGAAGKAGALMVGVAVRETVTLARRAERGWPARSSAEGWREHVSVDYLNCVFCNAASRRGRTPVWA